MVICTNWQLHVDDIQPTVLGFMREVKPIVECFKNKPQITDDIIGVKTQAAVIKG